LLRIPGLDSKLSEVWEGPYEVRKKLGPVTYMIDVGRAKGRLAHL